MIFEQLGKVSRRIIPKQFSDIFDRQIASGYKKLSCLFQFELNHEDRQIFAGDLFKQTAQMAAADGKPIG